MHYRRAKTPGETYFFTLVTDRRHPIFNHPNAVEVPRRAFRTVKQNHPFTIEAIVVRGFWEHQLWDDVDFASQVNYIHYNPVRHGFVNAPKDWPYSSFHRAVRWGLYPEDWGVEVRIEQWDGVGNEGWMLGFMLQLNLQDPRSHFEEAFESIEQPERAVRFLNNWLAAAQQIPTLAILRDVQFLDLPITHYLLARLLRKTYLLESLLEDLSHNWNPMKIKAIIWQEDDVWCASVPALPGCHTWGDSYEQLLEMLTDAVQGWLEVASERETVEPNKQLVELSL